MCTICLLGQYIEGMRFRHRFPVALPSDNYYNLFGTINRNVALLATEIL